ncbi:hypothetical protein A2311_06455 [candidate division WOR-1 bacterium RIFOXYB2_FULL_48_7]|uniref:Transcription regulator AsnC/Lrp ligand binding domain-containing protein n=1 Tax=candidate division WOR-1 bacterium RIFOXYB2_FULL_48_7 TaxID=1802583 RepID=A0A1F4T866_UNCSA|nr:MAG: hypothetical protein A2311_06455 [candidate division WOR-1 bacterium RIFOXYB2_FULL_48_7]HII17451.1 hypothetical protein [Candidatus Woesearchaeota archaeon]
MQNIFHTGKEYIAKSSTEYAVVFIEPEYLLRKAKKMVSEKDLHLLHHLRNDARATITDISKKMDAPITTVFDRMQGVLEKYVERNTSLLNFGRLGLNSHMYVACRVARKSREQFEACIAKHPHINTAAQIGFGGDYLLELITPDQAKAHDVITALEAVFNITKATPFNVTKELKREGILTEKDHIHALNE